MFEIFGIEFTPLLIVNITFAVSIAGISLCLGIAFARWFKRYRIFQFLWARLKGNVQKIDEIRREQMKESYKDSSDIMANGSNKHTFMQKIYRNISMSGIPGKIPGSLR